MLILCLRPFAATPLKLCPFPTSCATGLRLTQNLPATNRSIFSNQPPMNEAPHQYNANSIDEKTVDRNPLKLFRRWLDEAIASGIHLPEAMTLARSTAEGKPSARLVLLKQAD